MKRLFDLIFSISGIIFFSPFLLLACLAIFLQDFHSPFYIAKRVGKNNKVFNMIKLRSMIINADSNKVDSTSEDDQRITKIGKIIRKFKLDELSQIYNVLVGEMSMVGPRPNVERETYMYTSKEKKLLSVKPGITDIASIVFSDESKILKYSDDPNIAYNQLIRPWKSRLGLLYIKKKSIHLDLAIVLITILSLFSRKSALYSLYQIAKRMDTPKELNEIILRRKTLKPLPPPGSNKLVIKRDIAG